MAGQDGRNLGKLKLERKLVPASVADPISELRANEPSSVDGRVDDEEGLAELAQAHGVPAVDLTRVVITLSDLDLLPRPAAEAMQLLPIAVHADVIVVAMVDPSDRKAIDELEFVTGRAVSARVAPPVILAMALAGAYDAKEAGAEVYRGPRG